MKFTPECIDAIQASISSLSSLRLTSEERAWLSKRCPYLQPSYLDYLEQFQFRPEMEVIVQARDVEGGHVDLELTVNGKWKDVILYEVPLMAIVSQCYFELVDKNWSLDGQEGEH
jgi:nicotinate phosphoribosyltransferase